MRARRKFCNRARDVCRWMRRSRPESLTSKWRALGVHTSILHLRCSHRTREAELHLDTLTSTSAGRYLRSIIIPHTDRLKELVLYDQDRRLLNARIVEDLDTGVNFPIMDSNGKQIGSYKISSELLADSSAGATARGSTAMSHNEEGTGSNSAATNTDFRSDGQGHMSESERSPTFPPPPSPSGPSSATYSGKSCTYTFYCL